MHKSFAVITYLKITYFIIKTFQPRSIWLCGCDACHDHSLVVTTSALLSAAGVAGVAPGAGAA